MFSYRIVPKIVPEIQKSSKLYHYYWYNFYPLFSGGYGRKLKGTTAIMVPFVTPWGGGHLTKNLKVLTVSHDPLRGGWGIWTKKTKGYYMPHMFRFERY